MVVDHEGCTDLDKEIAAVYGILLERLTCAGDWSGAAKVRTAWVEFAGRFKGADRVRILTIESDARLGLRDSEPSYQDCQGPA